MQTSVLGVLRSMSSVDATLEGAKLASELNQTPTPVQPQGCSSAHCRLQSAACIVLQSTYAQNKCSSKKRFAEVPATTRPSIIATAISWASPAVLACCIWRPVCLLLPVPRVTGRGWGVGILPSILLLPVICVACGWPSAPVCARVVLCRRDGAVVLAASSPLPVWYDG